MNNPFLETDHDIEIIVPAGADERRLLDFCLVNLTQAISQLDADRVAHGFLGGEFGYGAEYENAVFEMHPFYWGDCTCGYEQKEIEWSEQNKHSDACYQTEYHAISERLNWLKKKKAHNAAVKALCAKHGIPWNDGLGCAVHCTCGYQEAWLAWVNSNGHAERCPIVLPNFRHKASELTVNWYKYIGRDMEMDNPNGANVAAVFRECMASLR